MTKEQDKFIVYEEGHSLLTAIPGSGKTTTSIKKIAAVLSVGRTIHAMSFTKEAARELREKALAKLDHDAAARCEVGTFHSMVFRALTKLPSSPLRSMKSIDESDARKFKAIALKNAGLENSPDELSRLEFIRSCVTDPYGLAAAHHLSHNDPSRTEKIQEAERWCEAVRIYEASLQRDRLYDFARLLKMGLDLVRSGTRLFVADEILIDEFQDVDEVQLHLILAHRRWSVLHVVGDDDQAIYKFRAGLGYGALQTFLAETGAEKMTLSLCFRCRSEILRWAQDVIELNVARSPKKLNAARGSGGQVHLIQCRNESYENALVAHLAKKTLDENAKSVAIVARMNKSLVEIQPALTGVVDFQCISCEPFWKLDPCGAAVGLLKNIARPGIEMAGMEVAVYWFGASERDLETLRSAAKTASIEVVFDTLMNCRGLSDTGLRAIAAIQRILEDLEHPFAQTKDSDDVDLLVEILFTHLNARVENDTTLSSASATTQKNILDAAKAVLLRLVGSLAQRLAIIERTVDKKSDAKVKLMTMHGSKGREFDSVFLIRAIDEIIPGESQDQENIDEERRLLYVGMTRARDLLTITYPRERTYSRGSKGTCLTRLLAVAHTPPEEFDQEYEWLFQQSR